MSKRVLALLLALVIAGAIAYSGFAGGQKSTDDPAASGIPEVVAEVNGEEITKSDFEPLLEAQQQAAEQQAQQGGEPVDEKQLREQVVQSLVTEELLTQEVTRRKITVTDKQVEQTLVDLATENGMPSADAFVAALQEQGLERTEIDAEVKQRTEFDQLIARESGPLEASDKQVRELYQQLKKQQESAAGDGGDAAQDLPPLKQVRPELEKQITSQQASQAATSLIDKLREQADINILV